MNNTSVTDWDNTPNIRYGNFIKNIKLNKYNINKNVVPIPFESKNPYDPVFQTNLPNAFINKVNYSDNLHYITNSN